MIVGTIIVKENNMKRLFIVAAIMLAVFASCAGMVASSVGMTQEDSAYGVVPKNPGENRAVAVFYGPENLKEKENKKAEAAMRDPRYTGIPEFGYVSIRIQGWTAGTANPKDRLFIVRDGNKNEVYRSHGSDSRPRATAGTYGATFWNLHNVYLKENYDFPLYVRVVTPLSEPVDITIVKK
jgi:hypothetical protein